MATGWLWAIAGLVLIGAEVWMPGVFMLWLGIAALATASVAAALPIPIEVQLALFTMTALLSCVVGWLVSRNTGRGHATVNDPRNRMVGSIGHVTEPIRDGHGKVRIGDSDWLAEGPDLAAGAAVRVKGLSGTAVKVEAV